MGFRLTAGGRDWPSFQGDRCSWPLTADGWTARRAGIAKLVTPHTLRHPFITAAPYQFRRRGPTARCPGSRLARGPQAGIDRETITHRYFSVNANRRYGAYPHPAGKLASRAQSWVIGAAGNAHSSAEERKVVNRAGVLPGWAATFGRTVHDGRPLPC